MVNPNNLTHSTQKRKKRALVPELPRELGDTDPLVSMCNRMLERIKKRGPRFKDKVETIHKPRAISINQIPVFSRSKPNQNPLITNINKGRLTFKEGLVFFGLIDNRS